MSIHIKKVSLIPLGLIALTLVSGYFLASVPVKTSAATTSNSTASITVGVSCNMTGDVVTEHDASIINGQYQENIGKTKLTTLCNDTGGYSIYAVGYSGDTYGNTDMLPATTSDAISTGTWVTSGANSVWTMKLAIDTDSYGYGNLTIPGNYNTNQPVPNEYTKVANYTSSTDGSIGSSIFTTYAAYVAQSQPADTYTGKVKYLMVHPNTINPTGLQIFFDTTKIASVAVRSVSADGATVATVSTNGGFATGLQYGVNYYLVPTYQEGYIFSSWENAADAVGVLSATDVANPYYRIGEGLNSVSLVAQESRSLAVSFNGTQVSSIDVKSGSASGTTIGTISETGGTVTGLTSGTTYYLVPNIISGNEFVSWSNGASSVGSFVSTDQNAAYTIGSGGTNSVTLATKSSVLYMQDLTLNNCQVNVGTNGNAANVGDEIDVVDERDNKTYKVRYINGLCWMTQNLRFLGNTGSAANKMVMTSGTSNGASTTLDLYSLDSSNAGNFGAYANHCDSTNGYNYACVYDSGSETTGVWYNYYAASAGNISTNSNQTAVSASGPSVCPAGWHLPTGAANSTSSEFYKVFNSTSTSWIDPGDYLNAFKAVAGGRYGSGSLNNTGLGYWWSATANSATARYYLSYGGSRFVSDSLNRYLGSFVRCVRS